MGATASLGAKDADIPDEIILGGRRIPLERPAVGLAGLKARFSCRGVPIDLTLEDGPSGEAGPAGWRLALKGDVGPIPFSAESALARAALLQILADAAAHQGEGLVIEGGRIRLSLRKTGFQPVGLVGLLSELVALVAPWLPYLEAIAVFILPPGAPGGGGLRPAWRGSRKTR